MLLAPIEKCTGCMACLNSCPVRCIRSVVDQEGFHQPVVDNEQCIECGKCEKACPILSAQIKINNQKPEVYAAWNKNEAILQQSSSGGIFSVLAQYILSKHGVVFGATYGANLEVCHILVDCARDLYKLQGSKYVQSNIGDCFIRVKEELEKNKHVLFTGIPCQVAGLYSFLGGDKFEKLFTCDLVCHGVPSPGVFKSYIDYMQNKEKSIINSMEMRTKKNGWMQGSEISLLYDNGKELRVYPPIKDPFMNGFLFSTFLRRSCYNCQYAKTPRESDITLGDFWGIGNDIAFNHETRQGISLVLINSHKGKNLFEKCNKNMNYEERTLTEAKKGNVMLSQNKYLNHYRKQFFIDYQLKSFKELIPIYLKRRLPLSYFISKAIVIIIGRKNIRRIKRIIKKT